MKAFLIGVGLVTAIVSACGGTQTVPSCTPGQSIACAGENGCAGFQTCNANGSYDSCVCGASDGGNPNDASTDGAVDSSSTDGDANAAFTPKSLSGLVLWLDDTVGVVPDLQNAGLVHKWLDQSGNSNDATGGCATGGSCQNGMPAIDSAAIHGHDAFICGGSNSGSAFRVEDSPSLHFGTGDWAVAEVYKPAIVSVVNNLGLWLKTGDPFMDLLQTGPSTLQLDDAGSQLFGSLPGTGKFEYIIARGPFMTLVTSNGSATGPTASGDISTSGVPVYICNDGAADSNSEAEIAEVVAVKGTLSDTDQANLVSYFKAKFGL